MQRNPSLIIQLSFLPAAVWKNLYIPQKLAIKMNWTNIWSEYIIYVFKISYDSFVKTREQGTYAWVSVSLNGHFIYASTFPTFEYLFTHEIRKQSDKTKSMMYKIFITLYNWTYWCRNSQRTELERVQWQSLFPWSWLGFSDESIIWNPYGCQETRFILFAEKALLAIRCPPVWPRFHFAIHLHRTALLRGEAAFINRLKIRFSYFIYVDHACSYFAAQNLAEPPSVPPI